MITYTGSRLEAIKHMKHMKAEYHEQEGLVVERQQSDSGEDRQYVQA